MPDGEMTSSHALSPRVMQVVAALSDLSLAAADGDFLGSEGELLERLCISRPTFRQAVKIVESDRLVSVRKGQGGGIFASRPNATDVIRSPARYLRMNGATLGDIHQAASPIAAQAARLAAVCDSQELRKQLSDYCELLSQRDAAQDAPEMVVQDESALARLVSQMSGNPAIQLFMEIGYTFGREERTIKLYQTPEDRKRARDLQIGLCKALLAHDAEIAALMMARRSAMIAEWLSRK